jgi:hypothetical protein
MVDYMILAARLQASPLYARLGYRHAVARMLMQRVYARWLNAYVDAACIHALARV